MVCETFTERQTVIHRTDGRVRIAAAVAFSVIVATGRRLDVAAAGLALAALLAVVARLPVRATAKRLAGLNVFMLMLLAVLPFSIPGEAVLRVGSLACSREGLLRVAAIALKGNAIVLALTALLSTMELTTLGHAMHRLRVPGKLVHLFFFTVRYIDVLHHEYRRLRNAMRVRCFRMRMNRHTYRSLGYLVGMLLVRSHDRAERIVAAMKCRAFRGTFHVLDRLAFRGADAAFGAAAAVILAALAWMEWA